jgi:hypothetical protein
VSSVLNDYTLANDLDRQFGDVPIGLAKMLFLSTIQGICTHSFKSHKESPGFFPGASSRVLKSKESLP